MVKGSNNPHFSSDGQSTDSPFSIGGQVELFERPLLQHLRSSKSLNFAWITGTYCCAIKPVELNRSGPSSVNAT